MLTGDELLTYVEDHRLDFKGNGDAICLAAGYGIKTEDGGNKCNFKAFVKALSSAFDLKNNNDLIG